MRELKSDDLIPTGTIIFWPGPVVPSGFLLCDGTLYLSSNYPNLFDAIGNAWGGTNATEFRVPDLRGEFLRGVSGSSSVDPDSDTRTAKYPGGNTGNNVGSYQDYMMRRHRHIKSSLGSPDALNTHGTGYGDTTGFTNFTGGTEVRPRNAYMNFIIKT